MTFNFEQLYLDVKTRVDRTKNDLLHLNEIVYTWGCFTKAYKTVDSSSDNNKQSNLLPIIRSLGESIAALSRKNNDLCSAHSEIPWDILNTLSKQTIQLSPGEFEDLNELMSRITTDYIPEVKLRLQSQKLVKSFLDLFVGAEYKLFYLQFELQAFCCGLYEIKYNSSLGLAKILNLLETVFFNKKNSWKTINDKLSDYLVCLNKLYEFELSYNSLDLSNDLIDQMNKLRDLLPKEADMILFFSNISQLYVDYYVTNSNYESYCISHQKLDPNQEQTIIEKIQQLSSLSVGVSLDLPILDNVISRYDRTKKTEQADVAVSHRQESQEDRIKKIELTLSKLKNDLIDSVNNIIENEIRLKRQEIQDLDLESCLDYSYWRITNEERKKKAQSKAKKTKKIKSKKGSMLSVGLASNDDSLTKEQIPSVINKRDFPIIKQSYLSNQVVTMCFLLNKFISLGDIAIARTAFVDWAQLYLLISIGEVANDLNKNLSTIAEHVRSVLSSFNNLRVTLVHAVDFVYGRQSLWEALGFNDSSAIEHDSSKSIKLRELLLGCQNAFRELRDIFSVADISLSDTLNISINCVLAKNIVNLVVAFDNYFKTPVINSEESILSYSLTTIESLLNNYNSYYVDVYGGQYSDSTQVEPTFCLDYAAMLFVVWIGEITRYVTEKSFAYDKAMFNHREWQYLATELNLAKSLREQYCHNISLYFQCDSDQIRDQHSAKDLLNRLITNHVESKNIFNCAKTVYFRHLVRNPSIGLLAYVIYRDAVQHQYKNNADLLKAHRICVNGNSGQLDRYLKKLVNNSRVSPDSIVASDMLEKIDCASPIYGAIKLADLQQVQLLISSYSSMVFFNVYFEFSEKSDADYLISVLCSLSLDNDHSFAEVDQGISSPEPVERTSSSERCSTGERFKRSWSDFSEGVQQSSCNIHNNNGAFFQHPAVMQVYKLHELDELDKHHCNKRICFESPPPK